MTISVHRNDGTRELAIFKAGDILCGLDTTHVQEINKNMQLTTVHLAPDFVRGVINLRGEIVTIIDLREKFGFPTKELNDKMRIVVTRQSEESIGLLVDSVSDVIIAKHDEIEPPPSNVSGITGVFFEGIYKMDTDLIAVLNIQEVLKDNKEK
jgi:purine-binding chemotaxis protein CheW